MIATAVKFVENMAKKRLIFGEVGKGIHLCKKNSLRLPAPVLNVTTCPIAWQWIIIPSWKGGIIQSKIFWSYRLLPNTVLIVNICAKFQVDTLNGSRDITKKQNNITLIFL